MIDFHHTLYLCWYLSPPWCQEIPLVEVNLLEKVYICTTRTFGYCCGIRWEQDRWIYAVICNEDIIYTTEHQIIGTGEMQLATQELPAFVLGDRVMLRSDDQWTKQRIVLGIYLLNKSWFYYVESMPPALKETTSLNDRLAFVPQKNLVRVLF
ncbi:DUF1392 family protein [Nostoc sp. MG11]|uniref:DUF1392 family protein n=1 Tax=Nostoc sp. MG11 TaxID=2721166 RepID=UPI001866CDE9|nr:DUF1392 family protein [Nostoc sp. MG11]